MRDHRPASLDRGPARGRRRNGGLAVALAVALALPAATALFIAPAHAAPQPSYTLDSDPLRLGNRQLEAGAWDAARARFEEAVRAGYRLDEAQFGLGVCALRVGQYAEAEQRFDEALTARGGAWSEARGELGLLLLRRGQNDQAGDLFDEAVAGDAKCWPALYGQALLLLTAGDWEAARGRLETGKDRRGVLKGEDRYHHGKALVFLANGAIAQAGIAALQAQGLDPADPRYTALVARVYQEQGYDELAISAWEQLLELPGVAAGAPTLHELGRLYAKAGRPNDARLKFEQACTADSSYVPALRDLAELFRRAKRPENAARTWLRYAQVAPGDIEAQLGLAGALNELGRRDEAAAAARAALTLNPAHTGARLVFVQAGLRSREAALRAEAAAMADSLLQLGDLAGWLLEDQLALVDWQSSQGREHEARAALARAALMDSTSSSVPFQQGLLELKAGRAAEAATRFERAVALDPQSAGAYLNLGIARYQSGSPGAAIADFRRAVGLDAELTLARLLLGQALAAVDSLAAAESTYREVLAREATNAKALRGVGFCRLRAGDYPGAARAYEQSTQTEPDSADGWAGLGSAQLGQGRLDAAGAAFTKARAIDPNNAMLKTGSDLLTQARNAGKEAPSR